MPKKAAATRSGAQRYKAKAQKGFEVVRQNAEEQEVTEDEQMEITPISTPTPSAEAASRSTRSARRVAQRVAVATPEVEAENEVETENEVAPPEVETESEVITTPVTRGSASARLAARRGQKGQQRAAATLITSEHYAYVTRDLMIIAVLASLMFVAIIVLYFTLGR
jgi:hypothetical protein